MAVVQVAIATCLAGSKHLLYVRGQECDMTRLRPLNTRHKPPQQVFLVRKVRDEKPEKQKQHRLNSKDDWVLHHVKTKKKNLWSSVRQYGGKV